MRDAETYRHCIRVSRGARLLARAAGLAEIDQRTVEFTGLFHDIGKVGIPENILNKPGRLTEQEMGVMKDHPELSVKILQPLARIDFFSRLIPGVLHHHEWFDGRGYPHCIEGEKIPLESRIVLIADTFDAMTADRPYRKGRSADIALAEIQKFSGSQFDPQLVKIYLQAQPTWGPQDTVVFEEMNQTVLKIAT